MLLHWIHPPTITNPDFITVHQWAVRVECCLFLLTLNKYGGHEDQLSRLHWGMDRFRVKALDNLLGSAKLSPGQYQATRRILISKSEILVQGALKRNNTETAKLYQALINKHTDIESVEQRNE